MQVFIRLVLMIGLAVPVLANAATEPDETPLFQAAGDLTLDQFLWVKRVLVVFADTPADPRFHKQMQALETLPDELLERDVVVITDTDPGAQSLLRTQLRPRGFMMVLVGKDGQIKLRKPQPWDVREITRSIDKTPLRQQEIKERRAAQ